MINPGVKETLCTRCIHRKVCKHLQDYLRILNVVENYDFVNRIDVGCEYYGNLLMEGEEMVLYVVHGNTYYGVYGHVENIFGIYTEKKDAEAAKDLMIKNLYEKNTDNAWTYVEDIEDIKVDILEINANELVDIELGGYCE